MIELSTGQSNEIFTILNQYLGKTPVYAFGSRARHDAREHSDLDLLIKGDSEIPQALYYQLKDAFEESDLSIKVDVIDWYRISEDFQQTIAPECIKFYPVEDSS